MLDFSPPTQYKTYACTYFYQGSEWGFEIKALSYEDAENRLKAISNGKVAGELVLTFPVSSNFLWKGLGSFLKSILNRLLDRK